MSIATAIFYILSNDAAVGPELLNDDGTYRIHPLTGYLTENTPFVTVQELTATANNTKPAPSSVDTLRIQVNIMHDGYDEAKALAAQVRTALDYKSGTFNGVQVQYMAFQSSQDVYDDGSKLNGAVMIAQDYLVRLIN